MFEVRIAAKPVILDGNEALNWYRARKLTEFSRVNYDGTWPLQKLDVGPTFARVWFPKNTSKINLDVDLDDFGHEEIKDDKMATGWFADSYISNGQSTFKLRLTTAQIQWLVIKDYIDRSKN